MLEFKCFWQDGKLLTRVWSIRCHIKSLGETNRCVEFFAPHGRVVESLQVDDQNLGEAVYRQIFFDVHFLLALAAFESCLDHPLRLDVLLEALGEFDAAKEADCLPRDLDTEIHEVVKGTILEAAVETLRPIEQLPLK